MSGWTRGSCCGGRRARRRSRSARTPPYPPSERETDRQTESESERDRQTDIQRTRARASERERDIVLIPYPSSHHLPPSSPYSRLPLGCRVRPVVHVAQGRADTAAVVVPAHHDVRYLLGFRLKGSGSRFRVQGFGFKDLSAEFHIVACAAVCRVQGVGCEVKGAGCRV